MSDMDNKEQKQGMQHDDLKKNNPNQQNQQGQQGGQQKNPQSDKDQWNKDQQKKQA
jgi:hypothetical protein